MLTTKLGIRLLLNKFEQIVMKFIALQWCKEQLAKFWGELAQHKKASNHHANLPLEMYSFSL